MIKSRGYYEYIAKDNFYRQLCFYARRPGDVITHATVLKRNRETTEEMLRDFYIIKTKAFSSDVFKELVK